MTFEEFVYRTKEPVNREDYKIIEKVYTFHPCISNTKGKEQIAMLYDTFGMRIIRDMLPTAQRCEEFDRDIREARARLREIEQAQEEYLEGCHE